jgi:uncharacterized membrane protein YraQ (UPF0718 family)
MNTMKTILTALVVIALLYVAFIVGAVVLRVVLGLLAILVAGFMVRMLVTSWGERRPG